MKKTLLISGTALALFSASLFTSCNPSTDNGGNNNNPTQETGNDKPSSDDSSEKNVYTVPEEYTDILPELEPFVDMELPASVGDNILTGKKYLMIESERGSVIYNFIDNSTLESEMTTNYESYQEVEKTVLKYSYDADTKLIAGKLYKISNPIDPDDENLYTFDEFINLLSSEKLKEILFSEYDEICSSIEELEDYFKNEIDYNEFSSNRNLSISEERFEELSGDDRWEIMLNLTKIYILNNLSGMFGTIQYMKVIVDSEGQPAQFALYYPEDSEFNSYFIFDDDENDIFAYSEQIYYNNIFYYVTEITESEIKTTYQDWTIGESFSASFQYTSTWEDGVFTVELTCPDNKKIIFNTYEAYDITEITD